jgi:hypothetical protein
MNRPVVGLSGAEVIKAEVWVPLFAAIEVVVPSCPGFVGQVSEGVVIIRVGDCPGKVHQLPDTVAAVIAVDARRPGSTDDLNIVSASICPAA